MIGHVQLSLLVMGGPHWGIDNYRAFNHPSDFAENWLKGVYMYQDDACGNHSSISLLWNQ